MNESLDDVAAQGSQNSWLRIKDDEESRSGHGNPPAFLICCVYRCTLARALTKLGRELKKIANVQLVYT